MVHLSSTYPPGLIMSSVLPFLLVALSLSSAFTMPEPPMFPPQDMSDILDMNGTVPEGPGDMTDSYCDMVTSQVPWSCVCTRCKASLGPKGDRGDRGMPGMPGSPGRRGLTGGRGRPGFSGRTGIKGQKGDEGVKGDTGEVGRMGSKGERGFKGDKGDHGSNGPPGDVGPQGLDGMCPDRCETMPGPPGPGGLPGLAGPRGPKGNTGSKGDVGLKGDTGGTGVNGVPGKSGVKGDQGPEGDCNCEDGTHGRDGAKGDQGNVGAIGAKGDQGSQGIEGEQGDLGPMGMNGIPGPCMPAIQSSFSAALAAVLPEPSYPVVFANVLNNPQSHYSPLSGIYTAPVAGTYVFSYHLTVRERILKVGLFHNYFPKVKSTETSNYGTASQQVVLHLNPGDGVWIQVKSILTNGLYTSSEDSSTFSGFLLHPDSCEMSMTGRDGPDGMSGEFVFKKESFTWDSEEP